MAGLCIPKEIVDKVRTAIKSGNIPLENLYDMTSEERSTLFSHYVGEASSHLVNTEFEKGMVVADRLAKADYVTASEKGSFAKSASVGEFGKKLLNPKEKSDIAVKKIDEQITMLKKKAETMSSAVRGMDDGEDKANLQFKLNKLNDQIDRLNVKKEDALNPNTDTLLKKINGMSKLLSPEEDKAMLEDLVKSKMGQDVSPAQGKYIVDQSTKLQALKEGNKAAPLGVTSDYLQAKANLEHFIDNMNPEPTGTSIMRNLIEIVKNNFITSVKTPLKTAISAIQNNPAGMLIRRLSHFSAVGDYRTLVNDLQKEDIKIANNTGNSIATMRDLNDTGSVLGSHKGNAKFTNNLKEAFKEAGKNETFNAPTISGKAKGILGAVDTAVAKTAQLSHWIAIDVEHNILFQKVYRSAFYDTLNFRVKDILKTEGLKGAEATARGEEIIRDAARVEPQTDAGKALRATAQESAMKVLNVNNTIASEFAAGIKNTINGVLGDKIPLGNLIEPFAKIPANVIENAYKTTPMAIPEGIYKMWRGVQDMSEDNIPETRYKGASTYRDGVEQMIGIFGSVAIAATIVSSLSKKDFKQDQYGGSYVKIGNTWISTEYFSRLAPNIALMMAMKSNETLAQGTAQTLAAFKNMPGVSSVSETVSTLTGKNGVSKTAGGLLDDFIPSIVTDLTSNRPIERLFFGAHGVESTQEVKQDAQASAKKAAAARKAK